MNSLKPTPEKPKLTFIGYSHDDRPMFWCNDGLTLRLVYGDVVTEPIGLNVGDVIHA